MAAGKQASDLGDHDLARQEIENAGRAHREWAEEQIKDLRQKARDGDFDQMDANDAMNIWYDSQFFQNEDLAERAKDLYTKMAEDLFKKTVKDAACPPSDAEMDTIYDQAVRANAVSEDMEKSAEIFELAKAKMEQAIRQKAQAPDANYHDLANLASRWGLDELVGEFNQYLDDGKNHVKPPRCEVTWSGTITVVRTIQYHRLASSPDEGTEDDKFQATFKVNLALDRGEAAWESQVTGSADGEWVMHEESPECGPSVIRTVTNYKISGSGGSSLRPIKPSITIGLRPDLRTNQA